MIPATYIAKKVSQARANVPAKSASSFKDNKVQKTVTYIGLGTVGLAVTYLATRKIIKKIRQTRSERNFTLEGQQALLIRSALNPAGISWLAWMDGTKEESLYNIAYKIKDFRKVQVEYRNLFNRSLVKDLEKELKIEEYQKFMDIINSGGYIPSVEDNTKPSRNQASGQGAENQVKGKVILIEKSTRVYEKFAWYPWGSVKKVEPGYFINHLANGNIKKVPSGYGRYADFIETVIKTTEGSVKKIYINKADVKLVTKQHFNAGLKNRYTKIIFRDSDF